MFYQSIGNSIQANKDKIEKLEKQNARLKKQKKDLQQENKQLKEIIEELENKLNEDIQDLNNMKDGIIRPSELIKSLELYLQILDKAKENK